MKTAIVFLCFASTAMAQLRPAEIESLLLQAKTRLETSLNVTLNVKSVPDDASTARANGEIRISVRELSTLLVESDKASRLLITMYVISHEYAHVRQFNSYQIDQIIGNDPAWQKTLEAQADILAAFMVGNTVFTPELLQALGEAAAADATNAALKLFFEIGSERFGLGRHPSREARRYAAKIGIDAAFVAAGRKFLQASNSLPSNRTIQLKKRFDYAAACLPFFRIVDDLNPDSESLLDWSLTTAKSLTHFRPSAAKLLEARWVELHWYTDREDGRGRHVVSIRNNGDRAIRFFWEPALVYVNRSDPNNSLLWHRVPIHREVYERTLGPKSTVSISVGVNWHELFETMPLAQRKSFAPAFKLPPEDDSLWYVEFADEPQIQRGKTTHEIALRFEGVRRKLEDALIDMHSAVNRGNLSSLQAAPAVIGKRYRSQRDPEAAVEISFPGAEVVLESWEKGKYPKLKATRAFLRRGDAKEYAKQLREALLSLPVGYKVESRDSESTDFKSSRHPVEATILEREAIRDEGAPREWEVVIEFNKDLFRFR